MKKRINLAIICVLFVVLMAAMLASCINWDNNDNNPDIEITRGLDVSFLKDLSIDLNGIEALGIEKRTVNSTSVVQSSFKSVVSHTAAEADEISQKNKLVGEKSDKSVVEVMLKTKLGEIYKQDELDAQFNKLYVSGSFVYFELIPLDAEEKTGSDGTYYYYEDSSFDEDGNLKENAEKTWASIQIRDRYLDDPHQLSINETEYTLTPVTKAFVYSIENGNIYDLNSLDYWGFTIMDPNVLYTFTGGLHPYREMLRLSINEDDELEIKAIFNDYHLERTSYLKVDKYGNVFGVGAADFIDTETKAFIEKNYNSEVTYILNDDGQAVQMHKNGNIKWIDENGLRELQPDDNMEIKYYDSDMCFFGIENGVPKVSTYSDYYDKMTAEYWGTYLLTSSTYNYPIIPEYDIGVAVVKVSNGSYIVEKSDYYWKDDDKDILVWFRLSEVSVTEEWNEEWDDEDIYKTLEVSGLHVITEDFNNEYPNSERVYSSGNTQWKVIDQNGETIYEVYWDNDDEAVKVRVKKEIIAAQKEVNKFQPIG